MNAAAVFISLLFWGWLWGVWGMLLSIPIVVIAKVVSEHVEQLQPVAELLGEYSQRREERLDSKWARTRGVSDRAEADGFIDLRHRLSRGSRE